MRASDTIDLDKVIEHGVQAVFERESIVRVDHLVSEIVRLAPGQASNEEIENAVKNGRGEGMGSRLTFEACRWLGRYALLCKMDGIM
jgi:hypothetical protein